MGGDVMGKLAIPIIREAGGRYRATIHGRVEHFASDEPRSPRPRSGSGSSASTTSSWTRTSTRRPGRIRRRSTRSSSELATERLVRWIDLAETKLAGTGHPLLRHRRQRRRARGDGAHGPIRHAQLRRLRGPGRPARRPPHHGQHAVRQPDPVADPARGARSRARRADRPRRRGSARLRSGDLQLPRATHRFDARHLSAARLDDRPAVADRVGRAAGPVRRGEPGRPRRDRALPADCSACTATSTNPRRPPGSVARCASIPAASTARASCAAA